MQQSLARLSVTLVALALPSIGNAQAPSSNEAVPEGLTATDWSSIREALEAGRHAAFAVDGGYEARNVGQLWVTRFDGRGFTVRPDAGGWKWGLELQRYGFVGQERAVTSRARTSAQGQRVTYAWDDVLEEWYVNDRRGLEHGYTIHRRPLSHTRDESEERSLLTLALAVRGELLPEVDGHGCGVRFLDDAGAAVLTYSGLAVFDADGHTLPARFEWSAERLLLTIDERDARYPLTVDPTAQQAYLKAQNTGRDDTFGSSVAISGDTVVVGAALEDSASTGVNGEGANNDAPNAGAAYVFVRSGSAWSRQAYLKASNTDSHDRFGLSVAVSGDTIVVGAPYEDSNATGVNGDQADNSATDSGAVYVFVRSGTTWSQQAYLKASNTDPGDVFGVVSVSGDTVVVGAPREASNSGGVNGNQGNNEALRSGAAYVFTRSGTSWSQEAYLKASNSEQNDDFGGSVSVSRDTAVVGAPGEASNAGGVNGNQGNNSSPSSGAAYVFVRNGTAWSQEAYVKAPDPESQDYFAGSVTVSGDTVVAGAYLKDTTGAAYVFVRSGTTWGQLARLEASNAEPSDAFGGSVSVSGDTIVVGAPYEDSIATTVNGNQGNVAPGFDSGAAYVYVPLATAKFRNAGSNPASYSAPPPVLGSTWTVTVDLTTTGHDLARVRAFSAPGTHVLAGGQVLLVAGAALGGLPSQSGPLATWSVPIPDDSALAGFPFTTQALHFGGITPFALSNAQDLAFGYGME